VGAVWSKLAVVAWTIGALLAPTAQARELRAADIHPGDYPTVLALQEMGRLLAERSGGRWGIKVFHSRQLGEEQETIEQTRVGAIDIVRVNLTPFNTVVPETLVPSLPFLFRSVEHMHRVVDGPIGDEILRAFERHGFVALAYYDSGARSFYSSVRPIRTPADLKGQRIRVQQSPLAEAMVESLGAIPVPLSYGQVGIGLKTKVIDGAENNSPSYLTAGHYESARHYSLSEHMMAPEVVVMSKKVWDGLPAADQTLIRQAATASVPFMRRLWAEREKSSKAQLTAAGVKITPVSRDAFVAAMGPVYDRFVTDPRLKHLVHRIHATD